MLLIYMKVPTTHAMQSIKNINHSSNLRLFHIYFIDQQIKEYIKERIVNSKLWWKIEYVL